MIYFYTEIAEKTQSSTEVFKILDFGLINYHVGRNPPGLFSTKMAGRSFQDDTGVRPQDAGQRNIEYRMLNFEVKSTLCLCAFAPLCLILVTKGFKCLGTIFLAFYPHIHIPILLYALLKIIKDIGA